MQDYCEDCKVGKTQTVLPSSSNGQIKYASSNEYIFNVVGIDMSALLSVVYHHSKWWHNAVNKTNDDHFG